METRRYLFRTIALRRAVLLLVVSTFLFAGSLCPGVNTALAEDVTVQINEGETRTNDGGLQWKNGKLTVINSGIVKATGPDVVHGVSVENGGLDVTNNENAQIIGKKNGVATYGTSSGTRVENKAGATIEGGDFGVIFADTGGTVANSGNITGGVYSGVYSAYETSVTNYKDGKITGGETGVDVRAGSFTNSGTVTGGTYGARALAVQNQAGGVIAGREGSGVRLTDGGTVKNDTGGSIAGDRSAIVMGNGTVTNTGTIGEVKDGTGTTTVSSKQGITINNSSTGQTAKVTNAYDSATGKAGEIRGTQHGIHVTSGKADITNETKATITGGESGIHHEGTGTVTNAGTITGQQTGMALTGAVAATNKIGGSIAGADSGIVMGNGAVTNTGSVTGASGAGIHITAHGTVMNAASGCIKGLTGILSTGGGADVIDNYGSIEGTGGTAISTGAGDDTVRLRSGSAVKGDVNTGDGSGDYLLLEQAGRVTGGVTGAEEIAKTGMGTWIVDGAVKSGKKISVTGVLRTNGTYTHEDGACLIIPVGDMGATGKISAKNAVLRESGGVYVKLLKAKDTRYRHYFTEGSYTILETDEGLTGEFSRVVRLKDGNDEVTPWLIPSLSHTAKNVNIDIRHLSFDRSQGGSGDGRYAGVQDENSGTVTERSYPALAMSRTQRSVSRYLDVLYDGARDNHDRAVVLDNLMATMNPETLAGSDGYLLALDQISGITHTAAIATGTARQSSFYQNLFGSSARLDDGTASTGQSQADSPIRIAMDDSSVAIDASFLPTVKGRKNPFGTWLKGYTVTGKRNGDGMESRYDYTIRGVMGGMDYLFTPDFRSGLAIGYSGVTVDMREVPDTNRQDSFQASGYASYRPESKRWYIDCALSYSWNKYETQRHINVGSLYRVANASYNGAEISGYLEGGHRLSLKGFEVTPLVFVLAMKSSADGFTETDAGSANLTVDGNETESLQSGVGLKVSRQYEVRRDFFLTPEIGTRWFHEFGDTRAILNAHFADTPSGSYVVTSDTVDRDSAVISFNLQAKRDDRLRFFLGYDLGLRRDQTSHGVTGWVRYKW